MSFFRELCTSQTITRLEKKIRADAESENVSSFSTSAVTSQGVATVPTATDTTPSGSYGLEEALEAEPVEPQAVAEVVDLSKLGLSNENDDLKRLVRRLAWAAIGIVLLAVIIVLSILLKPDDPGNENDSNALNNTVRDPTSAPTTAEMLGNDSPSGSIIGPPMQPSPQATMNPTPTLTKIPTQQPSPTPTGAPQPAPTNLPTKAPSPSPSVHVPDFGPLKRFGHDDTANQVSNSRPRLVSTPDGDVYLTFYDQGTVWARRYVASSQKWDDLHLISSRGVNPQIAVDDNGNAIIAYYENSDVLNNAPVLARKYTNRFGWPDGWGVEEVIAPGQGSDVNPYLGGLDMTSEGHAVVCWRTWDTTSGDRKTSLRVWEEGHGWDDTVVYSGSTQTAFFHADCGLARVGNNLRVVAYYVQDADPSPAIGVLYNYNLGTHSGSLGSPTALVNTGVSSTQEGQVGLDSSGNAFVTIVQGDFASEGSISVHRYTGGTSWTSTSVSPRVGAWDHRLRVHPNGNAAVIWRQHDPLSAQARFFINGIWEPVATVSGSSDTLGSASIDVDGNGDALATWQSRVAGVSSIFGNDFSVNRGWGTPRLVESDLDIQHRGPTDVTFESGVGVAAWISEIEEPVLRRKIVGVVYH